MSLLKNSNKMIISILFITTLPHKSFAFNIGIPGVISIGSGGIHVGSGATGTNVPLPACGGSICDALEKTKRDVTGQTGQDNAQVEFDNAVKQLNDAQNTLNSVNQQIQQVNKQSKHTTVEFSNYKSKLINEIRIYNNQYEIYKNHHIELHKFLSEAKTKIKIIHTNSLKISKESQNSASQINQNLSHIQFKTNREMMVFSKVTEQITNNHNKVNVQIQKSLDSLKLVSQKAEKDILHSIKILDHINSPEFMSSYLNNLEFMNKYLRSLELDADELMNLVIKSKENYNQLDIDIKSLKE